MLKSPIADLYRQSIKNKNKIFIVDEKIKVSYFNFHSQVLSVASFLKSIGINKGDRVGVLMPKSYYQVLSQLGIMASGAVMVPISDLLKKSQVQHIIDDCQVSLVITIEEKIDTLGPNLKILKLDSNDDNNLKGIINKKFTGVMPKINSNDNAAIIYTSGSTGMPKGIILSHFNLWNGANIVSNYLSLQEDDRVAQVLSLNFDYGLNQIFCTIHMGTQVYLTKFHFPKDIFDFIRLNKITNLALMPIFLNRLFDPNFFKPSFTDGIDSLRRITTSGGRLSKQIIDIINSVFPNTDLYLMYGLTESFRSTYLSPDKVETHFNSIGKPIPSVEISVLDENGNECKPNEQGELVHRGGVIAKGYWNKPLKTKERFKVLKDSLGNPETVVFSGDIVRRDLDGYLYFIGRKDNMIKTSGHRVSPEEVERAVEKINNIDHAVVFSIENDILGEEIVLACVKKNHQNKPSVSDIKIFLRKTLAPYMVPNKIIFLDSFQITPGNQGKIDRAIVKRKTLIELKKDEIHN
jgi:amino acid adenylation domain-containing protein